MKRILRRMHQNQLIKFNHYLQQKIKNFWMRLRFLFFPHQEFIDFIQHVTGEQIPKQKTLTNYLSYIQTYYENMIDRFPGHIYWFDLQNRFLGCNTEHAQAVGFKSGKDIVGKTNYNMPWKASAAQLNALNNKVIKTGQTHEAEETGKLADGRTITVLTRKSPLKNLRGDTIGVIGTSLDITEIKRADQMKAEFIENMEHDIRTPIAGIVSTTRGLIRRTQDSSQKEILTMILNSASVLLEYLNTVLDFSHIADKQPLIEKKFNLHELVENLKHLEMPSIEAKKIQFSIQLDSTIPSILIGDPFRLYRILLNLLSNSIKFTEKGSISFQTNLLKEDRKTILLEFVVADTGMGIPKEQQQMIYEKFSRLTASNKGAYSGLGLGLNIVKHFITDMGGEIELESEVGQGCRFICTIPFRLPLVDQLSTDKPLLGDKDDAK